MIDFGFVIAAFVPLVLLWMSVLFPLVHAITSNQMASCHEDGLETVWRLSLGLGFFPAVIILIWRIGMDEPVRFKKDSMKNARIPYWLIIKRYWASLLAISVDWFVYDFITYPVRRTFL